MQIDSFDGQWRRESGLFYKEIGNVEVWAVISKVAVNRNDKVAKVDLVELLARRKRDNALKGSARELDAAIELARKYGPQAGAEKQ